MTAKECSEIFKNWATTITLIGAFLITLLKGAPYVGEKTKEIENNNKVIALETKFVDLKLKNINEIESTIEDKIKLYEVEYSKPTGLRSNAVLDSLSETIKTEKARKNKELEDIKEALSKNKK